MNITECGKADKSKLHCQFHNLKRLNIYMSVNKPIYFKKAFTKMLLDKIQNLEMAASTMYNVASIIDRQNKKFWNIKFITFI